MANVTVHAGDFAKGDGMYLFGMLTLPKGWLETECISTTELETVEVASEESIKKIGGTVGWGIVGGALLGPVGLLAGLLLGGKKNQVTFVAKFKDGRKFLATTDKTTYTKLMAAVF